MMQCAQRQQTHGERWLNGSRNDLRHRAGGGVAYIHTDRRGGRI
jgi:hypothetical protein